jgi:periplasmic copper chaperone A
VIVLGAAWQAPGAAAHVTLQPTAGRPADLQRYRVIVPNERESQATTGVDLRMPAGITFALVESVAGWRTQVVKHGSEIAELRWRHGRVPPGGYAELHFIARNPVRTGAIAWKALQRYDDGSVVRWIGSPTSDQPAPVTQLSETATPVDVVSTHGESEPAATGGGATAPSRNGDGEDGLALGVAIAAAVLAAGALGLQLRRRRG